MSSGSLSFRMVLLGLGLAVLLGAGTQLMAQPAPPAGLTAKQQLRAKQQAEVDAIREAERVARVEGRIVYLRERLQITATQDPRWSVLAQAYRAQEAARSQARLVGSTVLGAPPPVTERLAQQRADLTARSERLASILNALTPLYATLSDDQKAVADLLIRTSE